MSKLQIFNAKLDSMIEDVKSLAKTDDETYYQGKIDIFKKSKYLNSSAVGEVIAVNDMSSIEHNLDVKLSSKNLIPYPYTQSSKTHNEITFTVNSDGSLTANGTATGQAYIFINQGLVLEAGTYTLSGCPSGGGWSSYCLSVVTTGGGYDDFGSGKTFTLTEKTVVNYINVSVFGGAKVENLTFYPQLEKGTTATAWASYITDFSGIEVSRYGKNLIPYPFNTNVESSGNVTYIDNGDGTITANGTADKQTYKYCVRNYELEAGNYIVSGCPSGGGWSSYMVCATGGGVGYYDLGSGKSFTLTEKTTIECYICVFSGYTAENVTFYPQIELGTTATEYEPYKTPQTATANADGTVEGLTSLSPNMTLITDTNGINIDLKYYKDIDIFINNLITDVALSGGE